MKTMSVIIGVLGAMWTISSFASVLHTILSLFMSV